MRKSIIAKILIGYVIYAVIGILFITILSSILTQNSITRIYGRNLYNNAVRLADNCKKASTSSDLSTASEYLDTIPEYLDANIWLVKKDGTIIYDSTDSLTNHIIADFNPAVYKGQYTVNAFENEIKKSNIVSIEPININYKIAGYLVLIQPMNSIIALNNAITSQFLFVFLLIFIISLLILLLLHFIIIKPLRKITEGANEFASGNLKYNIDIKSHDEMGYLAATLNYMSDELNNAEEYQKKFISNVSHDFRSPLTSIKGYLEAMIDGTIPPELHEKYMKLVITETERLTKLTQSTLTLQSLNSGGLYLDMSDFDINKTIKNTAAAFEGECKKKNIVFDLVFSSKQLFVNADMGKIQQVLYNLIDNAIKFSNNNSEITIQTFEKYDKAFISVKDQGIGIPKDAQSKIFNRFYKGDASRGKDKKGTGLGLAIVKDIITAHKENIDVISTEGAGTEFIFSLKLSGDRELTA
ncbi:MAG: HAMP domain-containing protein [Lachnospiraceae bacterium]|nr:HAMP domain-containing protein [Lachnospiraceae bacterium]